MQAPLGIRLKHRLVRSPLGRTVEGTRTRLRELERLRVPELALLQREHGYIDAILSEMIEPGWTCIDVGGHVGSFSATLRRLAPKGRIVIIEADAAKAEMLAEGFPDATVHAVAVADCDGVATFYRNTTRPGFSSLSDRSNRGETTPVTVPQARLDTLLGETHVDFLKLDVEGFELEATRGALGLLKRCAPVVMFEAGAAVDGSIDTSKADDLFRLLTGDLGYEIYGALDLHFGRAPLDLAAFDRYRRFPFLAFNYFALPPAMTISGDDTDQTVTATPA